MAIVKLKGDIAKNLRGRTDWAKLKQLSDAQILAAASTDPDNRVLTQKELDQFKRQQS